MTTRSTDGVMKAVREIWGQLKRGCLGAHSSTTSLRSICISHFPNSLHLYTHTSQDERGTRLDASEEAQGPTYNQRTSANSGIQRSPTSTAAEPVERRSCNPSRTKCAVRDLGPCQATILDAIQPASRLQQPGQSSCAFSAWSAQAAVQRQQFAQTTLKAFSRLPSATSRSRCSVRSKSVS